MTKIERLYKYLSGWISNRSFRKWLLELDNSDNFFGETDFKELKEQAIIFSNPIKIKEILTRYVKPEIVEKLVLSKQIESLVNKNEDILIKLDRLRILSQKLGDKRITRFSEYYQAYFQNTPRLTEKKVWNPDIFIERRKTVDKYKDEIMKMILKLKKRYYFEYK